MEFTPIEKQAIISLLLGIIEADGYIEDEELEFSDEVLDALECTDEDIELGQEMPVIPALVIVKKMTDEQKEAVADVIAAAIVADRVVTPSEIAVFDYIAELTGIYDIVTEEERAQAAKMKDLSSKAD